MNFLLSCIKIHFTEEDYLQFKHNFKDNDKYRENIINSMYNDKIFIKNRDKINVNDYNTINNEDEPSYNMMIDDIKNICVNGKDISLNSIANIKDGIIAKNNKGINVNIKDEPGDNISSEDIFLKKVKSSDTYENINENLFAKDLYDVSSSNNLRKKSKINTRSYIIIFVGCIIFILIVSMTIFKHIINDITDDN